ncbi:MAG: hypothetical protein ACTHMJ_24575 [Thermomicrobiales bacterium]
MATMDVRMEAIVRATDGETLGRVWGMVVRVQGRDTLLTELLVEGGAFERDSVLPFSLVGWSSDQQILLRVTKDEALTQTQTGEPADGIILYRNDPVYAVDARLGHIRGFYVDEGGKISDLLINDEVGRRLSMVSIRGVDDIEAHRIDLASRIAAMGELLKPPQAFYEPVELRSEEELLSHHSHAE